MAEACAADPTWPCAVMYLGALVIVTAAGCFGLWLLVSMPKRNDKDRRTRHEAALDEAAKDAGGWPRSEHRTDA